MWVINSVMSESQSTLVKGKHTLNEIVVANEVVADVKKLKRKVSLLCLKFIMRKSITL